MRAIQILAVAIPLALGACTGDDGEEIEGDDAGECSDGADNDQDGYFDCDDQGCWGSPDCGDDTNPIDTGSGTGGDDTGSGADETCAEGRSAPTYPTFSTIDVEYVYALDIYPPFDGDYPDCAMTFTGYGDTVSGHGPYATAEGSWEMVSSTCDRNLEALFWTPTDREAFYSFRFDGSGGLVESWTVHDARTDCEPDGTNGKFWASDMSSEVGRAGRVEYTYGGDLVEGGYVIGYISEQLTITFSD